MRPLMNTGTVLFFIFLFSGYLLVPAVAFSDEFKVVSFNKDDRDLSARTNRGKRLDDNDIPCAIIKVRSDIKNLRFSASNPVVGNVEFIDGEYWVYVSEGTRQLYIFTEGFIKFSYTFPVRIERSCVYVMALTSKTGLRLDDGKGTLLITSHPDNVDVRIDGFPDLVKTTPCSFNNYREGKYKFFFSHERYYPLDSILTIEKETTKQIEVTLKPAWGNLIVDLGGIEATIEVDDKSYIGDRIELCGIKNGLDPGKHNIVITKEYYHKKQFDIEIRANDTLLLNVTMEPLTTSVSFTSEPAGAVVLLDGDCAGKTPFTIDSVAVGVHKVRYILEGYADYVASVMFDYKPLNELFVKMKNRFKVTFESVPSHAEIWINGKYGGKTPLKIELLYGKYEIKLKKPFFQTFTKSIEVSKESRYLFYLQKKKYTLKIKTKPYGAMVSIEGENRGKSPATLSLPFGKYKMTIGKKGYFDRNKRVNLNKDLSISLGLARKLPGYFGAGYIYDVSKYSHVKIGLEAGWTYRNVPRLLTGLGIYYSGILDVNDKDIRIINVNDFDSLNYHDLKTDGFIEKTTLAPYLRMGYLVTKWPVKLTVTATLMYYSLSGYNVYISDKYYKGAYDDFLAEGELFYDEYLPVSFERVVGSAGILIFFNRGYFGADYYFPEFYNEKIPGFVLNAGICF